MRGLILKDMYTCGREAGIFLVLIIVFATMQPPLSSFAIIYAALLPVTALAYDERSKWDCLAAMMPYSTKELVMSKYLLGYIGIALASLVSLATQFVLAEATSAPLSPDMPLTALVTASIAAIMLSINLPFMFKFGVERGRIVFFVLIALTVFIGMFGANKIAEFFASPSMSTAALAALAAAATLGINLLSISISFAIYKKKAA